MQNVTRPLRRNDGVGMRRLFSILACLMLTPLLVAEVPARADGDLQLSPPVSGAVLRPFRSGPEAWSAGHRGVDLAATAGEDVRAAASGVVHFAGRIAGVWSVSVTHGSGVRTTYTPVSPSVRPGDLVQSGEEIGRVLPGHCTEVCLHWGLTDGASYFDPTAYLAIRPVELVPIGTVPSVPPRLEIRETPTGMPVSGPITSRFGPRLHPVLGVRKLHDGVDIAADCGTPVATPFAGTVVLVEAHPAYGNRVVVEHGDTRTAYAHLRAAAVVTGQQLPAGGRVGNVGSTGLSTGCHLHWMAWRDGTLVDPLRL